MAKKKDGVNKSDLIRKAMEENPKAAPSEIVEILKGKGHDVAVGLVYQVKQAKKAKKGKRGPKAKTAPSANGKLGIGASLDVVSAAAAKVGGIGNLIEIAQALDKVMGK